MGSLLKEYISEIYTIGPVVVITKLDTGYLTDNSLVETVNHQKFFLKCHRSEIEPSIQFIESAERFFSQNGIPVVMPIHTMGEESHFRYDGRLYSLYPFVTGLQYKRSQLTDRHIINLAKNLAQMHLLSETRLPLGLDQDAQESWDSSKTLTKIGQVQELISKKTMKENFDNTAERILSIKDQFISRNTVSYLDLGLQNDVLMHGDYQEQNVFFNHDADVIHIFDFEKAKIGPRALELVRSLMLMCFNNRYEDDCFEKAKLYISAYNSVYPIQQELLIAALRAYIVKSFHSAWVEGEHYLKNNNRLDSFLTQSLISLEYMSAHMDDFISRVSLLF